MPAATRAAKRSAADGALPPSAATSGPARALLKLGLVRDIDLALHLPLRYEDETRLTPLAQVDDGAVAQVEGVVQDARIEARGRRQLVLRLHDDDGEALQLRFLHFYPSQQKTWGAGRRLRVRGELRHGFFGREMVHPTVRVVEAGTPLPTTLTPVYPASAQLPQAYLRKAVGSALAHAPLQELLPAACVPPGLPTLAQALRSLHQPPPSADPATLEDRTQPAWQRLKFDELLAQQLSQAMAREARSQLRAPVLAPPPSATGLPAQLRAALPWPLTAAQQRVVDQIVPDLGRERPMNRLLQGDVGAGKTVVAALAAATTIEAGWQCALMAPTELLAEQHFRKLVEWLEPLGVKTAWLTGGRRGAARRVMEAAVADGSAQLVVGTQAVIQGAVQFARLGLAIVDEQHRFGVAQRLALREKGRAPAAAAASGLA
ncbi:MAG: DEAD/DEAH box helicase, partial [Rubrivivax sp.]